VWHEHSLHFNVCLKADTLSDEADDALIGIVGETPREVLDVKSVLQGRVEVEQRGALDG